MTNPLLCLRWNNHHPNFITYFKNLLEDKELVDVTIFVDGQQLKAHKVILSACSPFFKQIFSMNPCKHPVLILTGMNFDDLKTIIEFMYCGEINITDERLPDILEVAEVLKIRGLHSDQFKKESEPQKPKRNKNKPLLPRPKQMPGHNSSGSELDKTEDPAKVNLMEQSNENAAKMSCEYSTLIQGSLLIEPENYEGESSGIEDLQRCQSVEGESNDSEDLLIGHSVDTPPSPTEHLETTTGPIRRRRNSRVQQSENFHLALEAVRTGQLGFCKAAKKYGLNNRTLWLEYKKRGYPQVRSQPLGLKLSQESIWYDVVDD